MAMLRRFSNFFRGNRLRQEIEAELRAHTEMRIEDNLAAGMSPEEARRDAHRQALEDMVWAMLTSKEFLFDH